MGRSVDFSFLIQSSPKVFSDIQHALFCYVSLNDCNVILQQQLAFRQKHYGLTVELNILLRSDKTLIFFCL